MSAKRDSTRRDFLKGRAAADAVLDFTGGRAGEGGGPSDAQAENPSHLVHLGRQAMACEFEIYLNGRQYPEGPQAAMDALDLIDRLEDQLTVYRDKSELIDINRAAAEGDVEVEPRLFALLEQAVELYHETGGALDITAGPLSKAWGFFRRAGRLPGDDELNAARARLGCDHVRLNRERRTIRFTRADIEINLNSVGKGYALDRAGELLAERGVGDYLFHGGQSSVLAAGSRGGDDGGWTVGLRHPLRPQRRLAEFTLRNQALGTSGSATQFFHHQGRRYGHVLDPRTGRPAEGVYSLTVIAPSAALADALSTALYVLGPEAAKQYCREHENIAMLIVSPARSRDLCNYTRRVWTKRIGVVLTTRRSR